MFSLSGVRQGSLWLGEDPGGYFSSFNSFDSTRLPSITYLFPEPLPQGCRYPSAPPPSSETLAGADWVGDARLAKGGRGRVLMQAPSPRAGEAESDPLQGQASRGGARPSTDREMWLQRWGRGEKPPKLSAVALIGVHCQGRTKKVSQPRGPSSFAGRVPGHPTLLRTCSAASGSRCGSSSGTVNWIFRGLLSCSMAGAAAAEPAMRREGRRRDSGLGRARSLSAPLRSGPGPSPARSAPGSRHSAPCFRPRGLCGRRLAPHPPLPAPSPSPRPEP